MACATYLFFGKPGSGKTTTAQIVANTLNGKVFGTDNIRKELFPLYPDLEDFKGLEGSEAWQKVADWILRQDPDSVKAPNYVNMLFTLTPVFGYEPPEELKQLAEGWVEMRSQQSSQVYQEILRRTDNYLFQALERQDPVNRLAILDGTYGLANAIAGRREVTERLSHYGPVYAIEVYCSEKTAKNHLNARKAGVIDPGNTLAQREWIWDITAIESITEEEGFDGLIRYNSDLQTVETVFGTPEQKLIFALERLTVKINSGQEPKSISKV